MRALPLLCHNTIVYQGSFVPTTGMQGHVYADGLVEQDELIILGRTMAKKTNIIGKITTDVKAVIFDASLYDFVKALRVVSSGQPVTVWIE